MNAREPRRRRSAVVLSLATAALVVSAVETANAVAAGVAPAWPYGLFCAALTLGATVLVGLIVPGRDLACAVWAFAAGWLVAGWPGGLALGAAALVARPRAGESAFAVGLRIGGALALALIFGPRLARSLPLPDGLGVLLTTAAVFLSVAALPRLLSKRLRMPRLEIAVVAVALVLATLSPVLWRSGRAPAPAVTKRTMQADARPDVFLLVLDTVRADHLSVYGHENETTPELARFLRERPNARAYPAAYSNGTWTVPSHATLLTGRPPSEHGAHFPLGGGATWSFALAPGGSTVAEELARAGWAPIGAYANHWLKIVGGMQAGFRQWRLAAPTAPLPLLGEALRARFVPGVFMEIAKGGARANEVNNRLLRMVDRQGAEQPVFGFANYGDAHGPYAPPRGFRGRFAPSGWREEPGHLSIHQDEERWRLLAARYDEEILYLDHEIGRLFEELRARGRFDDAWVFVTSDHGEAFGEHGVTEHGTAVYDEVVRVPLLVFPPPGITLPDVAQPVDLADVATTIAAIAGAELPGPGRDLRRPGTRGAIGIEFYGDPGKARLHGELASRPARAAIVGRHKLVEFADGARQLFDLALDPGELHDVADREAELVERLAAELPPWGTAASTEGGVTPEDLRETLERLQRMGYVGAGQPTE